MTQTRFPTFQIIFNRYLDTHQLFSAKTGKVFLKYNFLFLALMALSFSCDIQNAFYGIISK